MTRLATRLVRRMQWRRREVNVMRADGPPTLEVVDYVGWRWLLAAAIHTVCQPVGRPRGRWAPVHRLIGWAGQVEDVHRNVVVSTPITTKQANALFPHLNGRHTNDDEEVGRHGPQTSQQQTGAVTDHAPATAAVAADASDGLSG